MYTEFVTRNPSEAMRYIHLPYMVTTRDPSEQFPNEGPLYIVKRKVNLTKQDRETLKLFHVK